MRWVARAPVPARGQTATVRPRIVEVPRGTAPGMPRRHHALAPMLAACLVACAADEPYPPGPPPPPPPPATALAATAPAPLPAVPGHSIDLAAMDRAVKPGDDFFLFANGAWYAKAEIPPDRSSTGVGARLTEEVEKRTVDLLREAAGGASPDTKKVGDFFAAYMDEAAIEARGLKPLAPTLKRIAGIADARALAAELGSELRADVDPLNATQFHTDRVLGLWVEQDLGDPTHAAPYLLQGGLGMPDRSYYLDEAPRMAATRAKYQAHVAAMLRLAGIADADAKAARIVALERKIAETHGSRVDSEDVGKANNVWPRKEFAARAPGM